MSRFRFPDYPDACGWTALLPPRMATPAATGEHRVKYAVVGAGYTGLAAARRLSELDPSAEIVVLEASTVDQGSAARNSGFVTPRDVPSGSTEQELRRVADQNRYSEEGFAWLVALMEQHGIACDLQLTGRIKGAASQQGALLVQGLRDNAQDLGVPHAFLDAEQMEQRIGTRYYRCGLFTEEGYLLQPSALIQGLAAALPDSVKLYENSPVEGLSRDSRWRLQTPNAAFSADTVVLATNAAVKSFGYLRDRLVTIYTYAAISEAMTQGDAAELGSAANWGLLPGHRLGTTVRRVGADRLMVRSLYSYEHGLPPDHVQAILRSCFHRRYPNLAHVALEYVWGGTTALTMNGSPFWGKLDEGLYASAGCNGAGIVKGTVLGKRLAELIAGQADPGDVQAAYGTANWIVPEPLRAIGFKVVSALERRRAGLEA